MTEITTKFSTNYCPFHCHIFSPSHSLIPSVSFSLILSLPFVMSPPLSLFFFAFCRLVWRFCIPHTGSVRPFHEERSGPLFLLVIFVHVLDTDSVRTPAAFALIELFLTCPPNKLAVRSCNVRARRWDSAKQSYSRHRSEPRNIRQEETIYWSAACGHIFQSESKKQSSKLNYYYLVKFSTSNISFSLVL